MTVWRYSLSALPLLDNIVITHLQALKLLDPMLDQLLHLSAILLALMLPESISRPSLRILSEVVRSELRALP
jgi:hypothetical protein